MCFIDYRSLSAGPDKDPCSTQGGALTQNQRHSILTGSIMNAGGAD